MQMVFHLGVHGTDRDRLLKTLLNNRAALQGIGTEVVTPNRHRGLFDEALGECGPLYAATDEGPWLMKLPDDSVAHLAELDEDALDQVGEELAATEEFEEDGWSVDEVRGIVTALADLAGVARAQGRAMFVWMTQTE